MFCCVPYKSGIRFTSKMSINSINIDDECKKHVDIIVKYYKLDMQEGVSGDYHRIGTKSFDVKNNNPDALRAK